ALRADAGHDAGALRLRRGPTGRIDTTSSPAVGDTGRVSVMIGPDAATEDPPGTAGTRFRNLLRGLRNPRIRGVPAILHPAGDPARRVLALHLRDDVERGVDSTGLPAGGHDFSVVHPPHAGDGLDVLPGLREVPHELPGRRRGQPVEETRARE